MFDNMGWWGMNAVIGWSGMNFEQTQNLTLVGPDFEQWLKVALVPKRGRRTYFYASALGVDSLVILGSFMIANLLRSGDALAPDGLNLFAALLPVYAVLGMHQKSYGSELLIDWRRGARRSATSFATAVTVLGLMAFFLRGAALVSREIVLYGVGLSLVLLVVSRYAMQRYADRLFGGCPLSELLICDGLPIHPPTGITAVDARLLDLKPDITDPHMLDRLGRLFKAADRVVISCPQDRRAAWAVVLKGANVRGELLTPEMDGLGPLEAGHFGTATTLVVSVGPLSAASRAFKRVLDLGLALTALIGLSPVIALVALLVKLDSRGPIIFVQTRLGRGNRLFPMYKFRSMKADLCDSVGVRSTARNDDRVTRVGRIVRATSIDELPQIINVLKGDMSFVGPRPHALGSLAGDQLFWEIDQRYWLRHGVKPGITGLAQVRGFRGATLAREDLVNRLQADLDYLNGWTIWRDIRILMATLRVVLHKNAF